MEIKPLAYRKRMLVLGATGMLGNAVFRFFRDDPEYEVFGTLRSSRMMNRFDHPQHNHLIPNIDIENTDVLLAVMANIRPDVVVNCIGLVKQLSEADDPLQALPINALLPHRLARLCALVGARLIHFSTDCVFSGRHGSYLETDQPDANDLYGRSKLLGEVVAVTHAVTLRTSIIGHELAGARSLVDWFLSQKQSVKGFRRAIFSGLPTVEVARVIRDFILPNADLHGLYHLSSEPINKFDFLTLVAGAYGKSIAIEPSDEFVIDRSLNSDRFRQLTGFKPAPWRDLVAAMEKFR